MIGGIQVRSGKSRNFLELNAKNKGGIIYWSEINAIDSQSQISRNPGGYAFWEEKPT